MSRDSDEESYFYPEEEERDEDFEDEGPQEDDLQTEDYVNFYQNGRCVLTLQVKENPHEIFASWNTRDAEEGELSDAQMWKQIEAYMEKSQYFPNVWFISDHGNAHILSSPKSKKRAEREYKKAKKAYEKARAAANKKYGNYAKYPKRTKDKLNELDKTMSAWNKSR